MVQRTFLLACTLFAVLSVAAACGGGGSTSIATTTTQPAQTTTTEPPQTTTTEPPQTTTTQAGSLPSAQSQQATAYANAILADVNAEARVLTSFESSCDPNSPQTCRQAAQKIHDANANLEKALQTPNPPCLQQADSEAHTATGLIDQATHNILNGIDQRSSSLLTRGAEELAEAGGHFTTAGELMVSRNC